MLDVELPPKIIPQVIMEQMYEKYIFLKVSWDNIDVTDLTAKQADSTLTLFYQYGISMTRYHLKLTPKTLFECY